MACIIHTNSSQNEKLIKVQKDLTRRIEQKNKSFKTLQVYSVNEQHELRPASVPFFYGTSLDKSYDVVKPTRKHLPPMCCPFEGTLRVDQRACRDTALSLLQKHKSAMLCCYTGFGKTVTSVNMATKIKFKTLIVVPKTALLAQWQAEIRRFVPTASVELLTPRHIKQRAEESPPPDFCVVNAQNLAKLNAPFLAAYGFVVVDEAHLQMTETGVYNLLTLSPRYMVGVTATPYREDGYNCLFELFFGPEKVVNPLYKKHTVYKVKTGFVPDENKIRERLTPCSKSKINWNALLDEQSKDRARNALILNIVRRHPDRVFLILVKRVEQGAFLLDALCAAGESGTSLLGKQQTFDKSARVLIGTNSKIGTGFDHPRLDTLLVAADMVSYYVQFMGRVMRRKDVSPVIFDLVDTHPTLLKHFETRKKLYAKHGGLVVKYDFENEKFGFQHNIK